METHAETSTVLVEQHDAITVVTLNRPDKLNAVNLQMHRELAGALKAIQRGDSRAVVLTGAGRAFCVGQDLTEFAPRDGREIRVDEHVRATYNQLVLGLQSLRQPVIAAVNGIAAGAGASLALAADLRVCSDQAKFMQAFIRIGLIPDTGSTWLLPRLVGVPRALELAFTGRDVEADEAARIGMVNRVVPHDETLSAAMSWASELAALPTAAIGMMKRAIYRSTSTTLTDALEHEAQLQQAAFHTHDHREGVLAFLEKREPQFLGR